jgi:glycosyltransferase involved in cell wall biosynthesis
MRVFHTIDTTGPGGAEKLILDLAEGTRSRGLYSHVGLVGEGWLCDQFRRRGFEPAIMPGLNNGWSLRYLAALVREIRKHRIDVIHSHLFGAGVYSSAAGLITRTPVVATLHGEVDVPSVPSFTTRLKVHLLNRGAAAHVFVSEKLRRYLFERFPFDRGRARVIYNGIPIPDNAPQPSRTLRRELGIAEDAAIIGCLGNVRPAKGYDTLLDIVHHLRTEQGRNVVAVVAGEADRQGLMEQILERREALGLTHAVFFLGYCDDKYSFLRQLDALVLPSRSEGFPFAPLEAMAADVPVIAYACGGVPELIVNRSIGILVSPGDITAMAAGIAEVLDDSALRESLVASAGQLARERYSDQAMLDQYLDLYAQAIRGTMTYEAAVN